MTTPAHDETKKDEKTTNASGSQPVKSGDVVVPKKRKRKRKPRKATTPTTEIKDSKEATKDEKTPTTSHKATTPPVHHPRKKTKDTTPEEKKEEHKTKSPHTKEAAKEETKRPNLDIKSDAHMLPGIENIHEYIATKKATSHRTHEKKEGANSFITPDGTDLLQLPGLYAIVPHSKGDHKLVYLQGNAPEGLGEDPRKRTPGKMYVKNGRDIYMVTLTMKEHPTLKDTHGEPYDVWLIENEQQLTDQIAAIKQGIGGGENFGDILFLSDIGTKETASKVELITPEESTPIDLVPSDEEKNQSKTETDEKIDTIPEESSAKERDTDISLSTAEVSDDTSEDTTDEISGTEALNTIENTIDIDIPDEDIAMIDLALPTDENLTAPDTIETDGNSADPEQVPENESEQQSEQITLDMNHPEEETSSEIQADEEQLPDRQEDTSQDSEEISEEISLDIDQEEAGVEQENKQEDSEEATGHFMSADSSLPTASLDLSDAPEEPSRSLFGSGETPPATESTPIEEESTPGGMFRAPAEVSEKTSLPPADESTELPPTESPSFEETPPSEPLYSPTQTASTMPGMTPSLDETTQAETDIGTAEETDPSSVNLDDLSIESPEETSIDLDNLPAASEVSETTSSLQTPSSSSTTAPVKKSSFPFHIIIRIVLFLLISGALVLVRKVMFPTIQGTKPVDTIPEDTQQVVDDTTQPTTDTVPPTDTDTPPPEDTNTTPPVDDTPPAVIDDTPPAPESLTLNELTEKLKAQQTDARKVLNIAKLLENKQAIKFSLAAMLKAGNVLERIETEPTITAQDVLQESQKIERYLQEANKLIE